MKRNLEFINVECMIKLHYTLIFGHPVYILFALKSLLVFNFVKYKNNKEINLSI